MLVNIKMMKNILLLIFGLFIYVQVFGTAQIPDLLIYKGDTVSLYSNPLELYFRAKKSRPSRIGPYGCESTACWRGYQAVWEIKNDSLFLNEIRDCCRWKEFYRFDNNSFEKLIEQNVPADIVEALQPLKGKKLDDDDLYKKLEKLIGNKNKRKFENHILSATKLPRKTTKLSRFFKHIQPNGTVHAYWFT